MVCDKGGRLFQSTHPHGVRLSVYIQMRPAIRFNPRTHTGCDHTKQDRGAKGRLGFNPRTHTGCDVINTLLVRLLQEFQSTHPHGVRLRARSYQEKRVCFNPRTHTGCDALSPRPRYRYRWCFNPRTHTGCDTPSYHYTRWIQVFQSTHPHGVRQCAKLHIISQ